MSYVKRDRVTAVSDDFCLCSPQLKSWAGGRVVDVDGTQVLVFEYSSERDREAESELISEDGSSVGSTPITWTDQPNFWASGRVIVEYLGSDQTMLSLLRNALGTPITIHEQISTE